jgi:hypothetical protein
VILSPELLPIANRSIVDVPVEAITDEDEDILNYDDLDDPDAFV